MNLWWKDPFVVVFMTLLWYCVKSVVVTGYSGAGACVMCEVSKSSHVYECREKDN